MVLDPGGECHHRVDHGIPRRAVEQLRSQGRLVDDTLLTHLSPAQSHSIGLIGTITVDIDHELAQLDPAGHRPLRESTAAGLAT